MAHTILQAAEAMAQPFMAMITVDTMAQPEVLCTYVAHA